MDVGRFSAMAVDGKNFEMCDHNNLQSNTGLSAWKQSLAALRKCCTGIMISTRFADMVFIICEQETDQCRSLRNAINASMDVKEGDPQLQCWLLGKLYTSRHLMRGRAQRAHTLKFMIQQSTAVCILVNVLLHHLELFAVQPRE